MRFAHVIAAKAGVSTSPPPPPPPPGGFTSVAEIRVWSGGGNIELGVPLDVATGLVLGTVGSARLNGSIMAQVDNLHTGRDGQLWFLLSASGLSANTTYTLSVSPDAEAASPVAFSDVTALSIVTSADPLGETTAATFSSTAAIAAGLKTWWRRGPVVSEGIYRHSIGGNVLSPEFLIAKWVDGKSKTSVWMDNGLFTPQASYSPSQAASPAGVLYTANFARGAENKNYSTAFYHPPGVGFLRYFGDTEAHATIQAIGWAGTAVAGHRAYWRASGFWQNHAGVFDAFTTDQLNSVSETAPASPSVNDQYMGDTPLDKNRFWSGSAWIRQKPFGEAGNGTYNGGTVNSTTGIGGFTCEQGQPGDNPDIGIQCSYNLQGMDHYDENGKLVITKLADRRAELQQSYRLAATGLLPRPDNGTQDYVTDTRWVGANTNIIQTRKGLIVSDLAIVAGGGMRVTSATGGFTSSMVGYIASVAALGSWDYGEYIVTNVVNSNTLDLNRSPSNEISGGAALTGGTLTINSAAPYQGMEEAHFGASWYPAAMLTGRYWYVRGMVQTELWNWLITPMGEGFSVDHDGKGNGMNRHALYLGWTDDCWDTGYAGFLGFRQPRGIGWASRNSAQCAAVMPDDDSKMLATTGWDRAMVRQLWDNATGAIHACAVTLATGTGGAKTGRFAVSGARRHHPQGDFAIGVAGGSGTSWMQYVLGASLGHAKEIGELSSDGFDYAKWFWSGFALLFAQNTYPVIKEFLHESNLPWTADGQARLWNDTAHTVLKQWDEIYDALRGVDASLPVKTTAGFYRGVGVAPVPMTALDYLGGRHQNCIYAEQYGDANGAAANAWMASAAAHYNGGLPYFYSLRHYLTVRS